MDFSDVYGYCDDPDQDCNGIEREPACGPSHGKCSLKLHRTRPPESEDPPWRRDNDCNGEVDIPF